MTALETDSYAQNIWGMTLLHCAAFHKGLCEVAEELLEKGIDVNVKDEKGWTPLHYASQSGNVRVAQLLISHGADVHAKTNNGGTPLHFTGCSKDGGSEVAEILIVEGSEVNVKDKEGRTPLHRISFFGGYAVAEILLGKGGEVNVKDEEGRTPLHYASIQGKAEVVQLLLSHGADVRAKTKNGGTPLHFAGYAKDGGTEVAELLLKEGSEVNVRDKEGKTPWCYASYFDNAKVAHLLLSHDADIQAIAKDGGTPSHFAGYSKDGGTEVAHVLTKRRHDFSANSNVESTPRDYAKQQHNVKELKPLLNQHAETGSSDTTLSHLASKMNRYSWAGQLSDDPDKLKMLLSDFKTRPDNLPDIKELRDEEWRKLWKIKNAKLIPTVMEILGILIVDKSTAQHAWTSMMQYLIKHPNHYIITLSVMEILCLCAEKGAQPTDEELEEILRRTNAMSINEELTVTFLKTLVSLQRNKHFPCRMQFLSNFHIVSQEMLQLGRQLVHAVYGTMENCLKSGKLIDYLLFISHEQGQNLNEGFIENSFVKNWLNRSPLHQVAIFVGNEYDLKNLPQNIVTTYIHAKDLHGCTPLHLAHLHQNEQVVCYLKDCGAKQDVTDKSRMSPELLKSPNTTGDHPDVIYKELCHSVLEANCGMRPLLVHSEDAAKALSDEVKTLFERLVSGTCYDIAKIQIAGSNREKLKAGRLDEVDILLEFNKKEGVSVKKLKNCLKERLSKISWEGIDLRLISIHGPWKFLRKGVTVSLDVVAVIVHVGERPYIDAHGLQGKLLRGKCPRYERMTFCTLETWNDKGYDPFNETYFMYEWDMIDSLPASCRLAIVIAKALVQAYDTSKGDSLRVKMPVTSYMIKIALFYILANSCGQLNLSEWESEAGALDNALSHLESSSSENTVKIRSSKLEYNPRPKWATGEDVDQHGEEARVCARKIFTLIKRLAQQRDDKAPQGWKLSSFWHKDLPVDGIIDYGEANYICDVCQCALKCLDHVTF